MIELRIDNAYKAVDLMNKGWPTHVVSMVVPDDTQIGISQAAAHLILKMHDTELENDPEPGIIVPAKWQIASAIWFLSAAPPESSRLLVHCYAGKSRSTPVAMGSLIQHGMTVDEAFAEVLRQRPSMIPNRLITRYVDEILLLEGELIEAVRNYYRKLEEEGRLPLALLKRHNIEGDF